MEWTDCPLIDQSVDKMSGAPVLRGSRVRPEDLIANIHEGPEWLAEAFMLPIAEIRAVLAFYDSYHDRLPQEYVSPERAAALEHALAS